MVQLTLGTRWRGHSGRIGLLSTGFSLALNALPSPWSAEVTPNCFIVRDADGQALSYIFLLRVEGIIIVDLPTGFNHEQKNSNANPDYHCQHDKKYFHDVAPRMIYATIDCTDDGERTAFHIARLPKLLRRGTNAETLTG